MACKERGDTGGEGRTDCFVPISSGLSMTIKGNWIPACAGMTKKGGVLSIPTLAARGHMRHGVRDIILFLDYP